MSNPLLPPNATQTELALAATVERIGSVAVPVGEIWNPQTCPAQLLPWLAWALSVDDWSADWPEATKREVIAASIAVHMRKGTVWALRRALDAAGYPDVEFEEWFEYGGTPYTGIVHVHLYHEGIDDAAWNRVIRLINTYKNVRSHIELRIYLAVKSQVPRYALVGHLAEETTIYPWNTLDLTSSAAVHFAIGSQAAETVTIYPA